jgi:hypothetical protein
VPALFTDELDVGEVHLDGDGAALQFLRGPER